MKMIQDDGQGDFIIPKGTFALITMVLVLVSCIATMTYASATMQSEISHLHEECGKIDHIESRLDAYEKHTVVTMSQIIDMKEDLRVIRRDMQELLKR